MCCGKAFWKGIVVFGLTFALGVFVSSFFTLRTATTSNCNDLKKKFPAANQKTENNAAPESKKCVPLDGHLKYERLTAGEKPKAVAKKQRDKKKSLKNEKDKQNNPTGRQFYNPSNDSAELQVLLHKEKCYESDGRK